MIGAFAGCSNLTSIDISSDNKNYIYSDGLVMNKDSSYIVMCLPTIETVSIPHSVSTIEAYSFSCGKIKSVSFPPNVKSIRFDAFKDCKNLEAVKFEGEVPDDIARSAFDGTKWLQSQPEDIVYIDSVALWYIGNDSVTHVKEGTTRITSSCFKSCFGLKKVTIPGSVKHIGNRAFSQCHDLTSIKIENGVESIGDDAFEYCLRLSSITLPETVHFIGNNLFNNCSSLRYINMSSIEHIEIMWETSNKDMFRNTLWYNAQPDGVIYVGKVAYMYKGTAPDNTFIDIKNGTIEIAKGCFSGQTGITKVTAPPSLVRIGRKAFEKTTWDVNLPKGEVIYLGKVAYKYLHNDSLENEVVTIADGTTAIADDAFYLDNSDHCYHLKVVNIPEGVTAIGEYAFANNYSLRYLDLPSSLKVIGMKAFYGNYNLRTVISRALSAPSWPEYYNVASVYDDPFRSSDNLKIYVANESLESYLKTEPWSWHKVDINNGDNILAFEENEWLIVKDIAAELDSLGYSGDRWNVEYDPYYTPELSGVTMQDGHITGLSFSYSTLSDIPWSAFRLPYLKSLKLYRNNIKGNVGAKLEQLAKEGKVCADSLIELDVSYNNITGNIGQLAKYLPNLTTLYANDNCFSEVNPMLSPKIESLNISRQKTGKVVEVNVDSLSMSFKDIPTVITYNHFAQQYDTKFKVAITTGNVSLKDWHDEGIFGAMFSIGDETLDVTDVTIDNVFRGHSGDTLNVVENSKDEDSNYRKGSSFKARLFFSKGDANFKGGVDAADIQSIVNYTFGEYGNRPFNFTAANTYTDSVINVQDVVCTADIILSDTTTVEDAGNVASLASAKNFFAMSADHARITVSDGKIILNSPMPVSAIAVRTTGNVKWQLSQYGLSTSTRDGNVVGYSLQKAEIPAGTNVIGTYMRGTKVYAASLSDKNGNTIAVSIDNAAATGVEGIKNEIDIKGQIYDIDGRRLNELKQGVNIIRTEKGTFKKVMR